MAGLDGRAAPGGFAAMSGASSELKAAVRRQLREALQRLSPRAREEGSRRVCEALRRLPLWEAARSILFYHPLADEPDIWPLVGEALGEGREVGLLRFQAETAGYTPCRVERVAEDLVEGRFGLLEPALHCREMDVKRLDLVLVPGIGFTLDGARLGRGKGYYDRFLSAVPGFKCGVAFDCSVVTSLPVEPHDTQLNGILTPSGWHAVA